MTVNERIKEVRNALHLTQIEFGEKVGISQGHLTAIEKGKRAVTDKSLKVICLQFNINEDWLRDGTGTMFVDNKEQVIADLSKVYDMDALDKEIITSFLDLPPEAQRSVANYIKFLAYEHRKNNAKDDTIVIAAMGEGLKVIDKEKAKKDLYSEE